MELSCISCISSLFLSYYNSKFGIGTFDRNSGWRWCKQVDELPKLVGCTIHTGQVALSPVL